MIVPFPFAVRQATTAHASARSRRAVSLSGALVLVCVLVICTLEWRTVLSPASSFRSWAQYGAGALASLRFAGGSNGTEPLRHVRDDAGNATLGVSSNSRICCSVVLFPSYSFFCQFHSIDLFSSGYCAATIHLNAPWTSGCYKGRKEMLDFKPIAP